MSNGNRLELREDPVRCLFLPILSTNGKGMVLWAAASGGLGPVGAEWIWGKRSLGAIEDPTVRTVTLLSEPIASFQV